MSKTEDELELEKTQSIGRWKKKPENWAFRLIPDEIIHMSNEDVEKGCDPRTWLRVLNTSGQPQLLKIHASGPIRAWKPGEGKKEPSNYFVIRPFSHETINLALNAKLLNAQHFDKKKFNEWTLVLSQFPLEKDQVSEEEKLHTRAREIEKLRAFPLAVVELPVKLVGFWEFREWQHFQELLVAGAAPRENMEAEDRKKAEWTVEMTMTEGTEDNSAHGWRKAEIRAYWAREKAKQEEKERAKRLEEQKAQEPEKSATTQEMVNNLGKDEKPKTVVSEVPKTTEASIQKTQPMPEPKIQKPPEVKPMVMKPVEVKKKGKKKGKRGCCSIQ